MKSKREFFLKREWFAFKRMDMFGRAGVLILIVSAFGNIWFGGQLVLTGIRPSLDIDLQTSSQVGDYFSGIFGTIWGLAATLLFFSSLKMQRRELEMNREELRLQREELTLTRKELEKQVVEQQRLADEAKNQADSIYVQTFERRFFNRLELLTGMGERSQEPSGAAGLFLEGITGLVGIRKGKEGREKGCDEDYILTLVSLVDYIAKSEVDDKAYYYATINASLKGEVKSYISRGVEEGRFLNSAGQTLRRLLESAYFDNDDYISG